MSADRKTDAHTSFNANDFGLVSQLPPHFALPSEEKPNLVNRAMRDRTGRLPSSQFKMGEPSACRFK
jgi:hypothetical protein